MSWTESDLAVYNARQKGKDSFQQIIELKGFIPSPKPSKYRNQKVTVDGITFDSKREAGRWQQLKLMHLAGRIRDLERQRVFVLAPAAVINGRKKPELRYCADFVYTLDTTGEFVVEDSKGVQTDVFRIKRHLMKTVHNLDILLT